MSSRSCFWVNGTGVFHSVSQSAWRNIGSISSVRSAWLPVKVIGPIGYAGPSRTRTWKSSEPASLPARASSATLASK